MEAPLVPDFWDCPPAPRRLGPDPMTLTGVFAAWALLTSVSFFTSTDLLAGHLFVRLAKTGFSNLQFGCLLGCDGLLLLLCMLPAFPTPLRSMLALVSSCLWLAFGTQVILAGLDAGIFPRSGIWDLFCGFGLGVATAEWPYHGGPGR